MASTALLSGSSSARCWRRRRGGRRRRHSSASSAPKRTRKKRRKSTRQRPRLLRTAWFYSGYMFLPRSWRLSTPFLCEGDARAVRTWKLGLSTSHWYLAPTCSVPVTLEEHRKIWSFLGGRLRGILRPFVPDSHLFGVRLWSTRL